MRKLKRRELQKKKNRITKKIVTFDKMNWSLWKNDTKLLNCSLLHLMTCQMFEAKFNSIWLNQHYFKINGQELKC